MENNSTESGNPRETVTLLLIDEKFQVEKQKLIDKSQYFAALLSVNYVEHDQTEHQINYDISSNLLQDFIDWIHYDRIAFITSETNNDFEELDRLLILLELSILFAADNLTEDITNVLERRFMSPKYSINILLLAQELNINVLRDLSLAVCLDRFDELPLNSILELSREDFVKIIGNINLKYILSTSNLRHITQQWMNHNHDFTIPLKILDNRKKANILHSIISGYNNREQFIHCWDGNNFFELTSFEYPTDIIEQCCRTGKHLEGMQITARKYDLYLCGGEYGIGSGRFNKNIWRYSLISKKWFLETVMPVERRHMITVFLKNKLLLVGGVGRYRQKLETVDVYDIYIGTWTSGAKMHVQFTSVPEHLIFRNQLIIYKFLPTIYIYYPDENVWEMKFVRDFKLYVSTNMPILTLKTIPCYIDIIDRDKLFLKTITDTFNEKECDHLLKTFSHSFLIHTKHRDHEFCNISHTNCRQNRSSFRLVPFFHEYNKPAVVLLSDDHLDMLYLRSIPIRNPEKFYSLLSTKNSFRSFFNLFHPAHLHIANLDRI